MQVLKKSELLGHQFTVYGTAEQPLFLAQDVAEMVEIKNISDLMKRVDDDEKTLVNTIGLNDGITGNPNKWFLTEDGLYEVLMQSRKPIAKQFKKGVKTILKEIRKTGGYIAASPDDTPEMIMAKALKVADATMRRQDAELKAAKGTLAAIKEAIRESTAALEKANRLLYGEAEEAKPVAVDAKALPLDPDAYTGSRWVMHGLRGASDLLWMRKIRCRVSKLEAIMVREGYLEEMSYTNEADKQYVMKCRRLTEAGKKFGRNKLFPNCGRYLPLYYENRFTQLLDDLKMKGYEL